MRIGRSLPPAAAPIGPREFFSGICGLFQGGKALDRFRLELKEYFAVKHCFVVSSGKAAFTLILLALEELFPGRDEVIIPAFTCYSVPSSVVRAGLRIRLCDLHHDSLDLDFAQLSAMLSAAKRPKRADARLPGGLTHLQGESWNGACSSRDSIGRVLAVVPTHLYGYPSDVLKVRELIQDGAVTIIEDAAQAMGETWEGRKLGTRGDVGFLSLGRGKALSTVEGGVILTNRDDIADVLRRRVDGLPGYGIWGLLKLNLKALGLMIFLHPRLFWIPRSLPFLRLGETLFERDFPILRMSPFQAGLAENWRERLEHMRDARNANVKQWRRILEEIGGRASWLPHSRSLGLLRYPIRVGDPTCRASLLKESGARGAGVVPVYPQSINSLPELKGEIPAQACPVAEHYARELVTLPTHDYLEGKDVAIVRRLLSNALN